MVNIFQNSNKTTSLNKTLTKNVHYIWHCKSCCKIKCSCETIMDNVDFLSHIFTLKVVDVFFFFYKFIVLGHELAYFVKHETKRKSATQRMKSSSCWSSLSIIYLSSSKEIFCNKSSASLCQQIVPLFLLIMSHAPMRLSLFKNLSKTTKQYRS